MGNNEHIGPSDEDFVDFFGETKSENRSSGKGPERIKGFDFNDANELLKSAYAMRMYRNADVLKKLEATKQQKEAQELQLCLRKMQTKGGLVYLVAQPGNYEVVLNRLQKKYPHFGNVIDFIRNRMRLNALKKYPDLRFGANLLLNGPAGSGKSSFMIELAEGFETEFLPIQCAAATNGFDLTGMSSGWGNGKVGKIHQILAIQRCPNPICLLDEIDKAGNDSDKHNFTGALFGLLEKNNAKKLRDEFVDIEIDASRINWFATSNNTLEMDSAILDRFTVLQVNSPNLQDLMAIIPQLYRHTVLDLELQDVFQIALNKKVINKLATNEKTSIRRIKTALETALSNAAIRVKKDGKKVSLIVDDLPVNTDKKKKQRIGFIH